MTQLPSQAEAALLAWHIYDPSNRECPEGWTWERNTWVNLEEGFRAAVYTKSTKALEDSALRVVSVCGALTPSDYEDCDRVYEGKEVPRQYHALRWYLGKIANDYGYEDIVLVGHSLGGSSCKLVAITENYHCIAFNSPGVADILRLLDWDPGEIRSRQRDSNLTQYIVPNDVIGCFGEHMGQIFLLPDHHIVSPPLAPHRAWDLMQYGKPTRGKPDYERALEAMLIEHPAALVFYPFVEKGQVKLSDLFHLHEGEGIEMATKILDRNLKRFQEEIQKGLFGGWSFFDP